MATENLTTSTDIDAFMASTDLPEMQAAIGINVAVQTLSGGGPYNLTLTPYRPKEYAVAISSAVTFSGTADPDVARSSARVKATVSGGPWTITHPTAKRNGSITDTTTVLVPDGTHYFNLITDDGGTNWQWEDSVQLLDDYPNELFQIDPMQGFTAQLGGNYKAGPIVPLTQCGTNSSITSGEFRGCWLNIRSPMTLNGIGLGVRTNGAYTAGAYNGCGLYSYSGGTFTLRASSADNANLLAPGGNNRWVFAPFTSPYTITAGTPYFAVLLHTRSAQTTAPTLYGYQAGVTSLYTNVTSGTSVPSSFSSNATNLTALPSTFSTSDISTGDLRALFAY